MKKKLHDFRLWGLALLFVMAAFHDGISQTVLMTENWETASVGQTPPAGWAVDLISGNNYTYFLQNGTHPTCTPVNGTRMVEFQSFNAATGTSNRLKCTTAIPTTGHVLVTIDFKWLTSNGYQGYNDNVAVQWSTNGTTWATAATIQRYAYSMNWQDEEISLPSGAANQPALYIAFLFNSGYGENCHLDLVHVNGYTSLPPPPSATTATPTYVGSQTAYLSGSVNANGSNTSSFFQYGPTTAYGSTVSAGTVTGNTPTTITGVVYPLIPGHLYHCRAAGTSLGGTTYGNDVTFTTLDSLPEVVTHNATNIGPASATLNGEVYPNGSTTSVTFDYGLTNSYGSTITANPPSVSGDSLSAWANAVLTSLTPATTYHFRIKGVNSLGTAYGHDSVFTTLALGIPLPTVITTGAFYITASNAGVKASVNPNGYPTNVSFQYGLTSSYGSTVNYGVMYGNTLTEVYSQAENLVPATLYHYRAVGTNAGGTAYGNDTTFVTSDSTVCDAEFNYIADTLIPYTIHFHDQSAGNIISWTWDFGDGSPVSTLQNPAHTYLGTGVSHIVCLTVRGADTACSDVICHSVVIIPNPGCQANFTYTPGTTPGNHTYVFTDLSTGAPSTPPSAWLWDFGDPISGTGNSSTSQNPTHIFTNQGNYNVCLSIVAGICTSRFCNIVEIQDSVLPHSVSGQVFAGGLPIQTGIVSLFSVDTIPPYLPSLVSTNIDTAGTYNFFLVPDGDYFVNAIPVNIPGYLPTFYGDVLFWEDATVIHMGTPKNPYIIHLVAEMSMPLGNGSISGQINTSGFKATYIDKITMLLMNSNGQAITYDQVNQGGGFSFAALAYGTYYLKAELAGITSDLIKVIISQEMPDPVVTLTFTGNRITGITNILTGINSWVVFPNPVTDHIAMRLDAAWEMEVFAEIQSFSGQVLSSMSFELQTGNNKISLPATSLHVGLYILRVYSKEGLDIHTKVVKTRQGG